MPDCRDSIAGKIYTWNIPPGFTKKGSRKFFFWSKFGKHVDEKRLDGKWLMEKSKLKLYDYKCRCVRMVSSDLVRELFVFLVNQKKKVFYISQTLNA